MVNISLRVLSRPIAAQLPTMYRTLGTDYDERVLPSIVNEVCCPLFFFACWFCVFNTPMLTGTGSYTPCTCLSGEFLLNTPC